jgi:hypothetical protein
MPTLFIEGLTAMTVERTVLWVIMTPSSERESIISEEHFASILLDENSVKAFAKMSPVFQPVYVDFLLDF